MLVKQIFFYLFLTLFIVFFAKYVQLGTHYINLYYNELNSFIANFLNNTFLRHVILLTALPLLMASIPALIYRLTQKKTMPHYMACAWVIWLMIVLSHALSQ